MVNRLQAGDRKPEDYLKNPPVTTVLTEVDDGKPVPFSDGISVSGDLILVHRDREGNVKSSEKIENVITYIGLWQIAQLVAGLATAPFKYIQVGTGGRDPNNPSNLLPPDPKDVALVAFYKELAAVTSTVEVLNNADRGYQAIARFACTFDFNEEVHINEACISVDSQAVSGTPILNRRTFYDRVMQPLDFLEVVWEISFTRYPKDKIS